MLTSRPNGTTLLSYTNIKLQVSHFCSFTFYKQLHPKAFTKVIFFYDCHNPSLGLATKARACKVAGHKGSPRITSRVPKSAKECEGMNLHTPKWTPICPHLGVLGQNAIWMWASWPSTKYNIRGKVVASPKSEAWWVLWVQGCSWLVLAPKVLK